jgi:hypothetical protein
VRAFPHKEPNMITDQPVAAPSMLPADGQPPLHVGQRVHVNSRTTWLPALVTSVARTTVGLRLHGDGLPARTSAVPPWFIRPADGMQLRDVQRLAHGDQVVTFHGDVHTVAAPAWYGRDGWWLVTFTDRRQAVLPAGTVLRLVDPTPQVTVNGQPIQD